jgi:hypothetical protein
MSEVTSTKTIEVSSSVLELLNNPDALKTATVEQLAELQKFLRKHGKKTNKTSKGLSPERLEQINKLKNVYTNFGYTDAKTFMSDFRMANMPAVTRSRIPEEKRNKIEAAIKNNTKLASIAVEFDVSESTVGNIKRAMELREANSSSSNSSQ